jgi:hypothetical protein
MEYRGSDTYEHWTMGQRPWRGGRANRHLIVYRLAALVVVALVPLLPARGEEGGSGHYSPGSTASFLDAIPGQPGLAITNMFLYRPVSANARMPIAGIVTDHLDGNLFADSLVAIYRTPLELLEGNLAFGGALPVVWLDVDATAGGRSASENGSGIGDLLLYPFLLGWTRLGGDLQYDVRLGVYVPTGKYDVGSLANLGKNYWTFEPGVALFYRSGKPGLQASAYVAVDFNTNNGATDYQTGTQFHVDATLAEHFAVLGGLLGAGAGAFYYQQIGGDSGTGATLGDFKGRTIGIGPVVSYATNLGGLDAAVELKWLPEVDVKNRIQGDFFWIKLRAMF